MNNNNNQLPRWVQHIRSGQFDQAEQELSAGAAQRAHDALVGQQVNDAVGQALQNAGPYGRYCHLGALQRVEREMQQGRIQSPQQLVQAYRSALDGEVQDFKREMRPGYQRSTYEPYTPADVEVRDYVADRRAQQEALKEEGKRITNATGQVK